MEVSSLVQAARRFCPGGFRTGFTGPDCVGMCVHSVVFWFGDLNFRINDLEMQVVKSAIESNKLAVLWEKDQVKLMLRVMNVNSRHTE